MKGGKRWVMAVYFPRGQEKFESIRDKLLHDLEGVARNGADGLVFVTNQELTLGERKTLKDLADHTVVELYHLERVTAILDQPHMASVREQFLEIVDSDGTVYNLGGAGGAAPGAGGGGGGVIGSGRVARMPGAMA